MVAQMNYINILNNSAYYEFPLPYEFDVLLVTESST